MRRFSEDEVAELESWLTENTSEILPKMRASRVCLAVLLPDHIDPFLALQVGMALLLDKPLIIIGVDNAWLPERVRQLADVVIEGSMKDPATAERAREALRLILKKQGQQTQ